jgi:hypothetical protein
MRKLLSFIGHDLNRYSYVEMCLAGALGLLVMGFML